MLGKSFGIVPGGWTSRPALGQRPARPQGFPPMARLAPKRMLNHRCRGLAMSRSKMNGFKGLMLCGAILGGGLAPTTLHAAPPPATWDGLTHVKAKKVDAVYLLPGADFRGYTK